jgi:RNA polymerase sigma-B factor
MLIDTPTDRPATAEPTTATEPSPEQAPGSARRRHDDAPDTAALFARLATLDDGPERDAVRDELVTAWPTGSPAASATAGSPWRICGRWRPWDW